MNTRTIAVVGGLLILVGIVGIAAVFVFGSTAMMNGPTYTDENAAGASSSLGQRIYHTGVGTDEAIPRSGGIRRMGSGGCVTCHGQDGQGGQIGMMSNFTQAPPITYEILTSPHEEHDGVSEPAWTEDDIAQTIRTGETPDGDELDPIMPRWDMNDREMDALIDYLKTLDGSE